MLDKFNGIIYLSIFIVHFIVYAVYAFRTVVATKSFLDQYNIDHSAAVMVRFFWSTVYCIIFSSTIHNVN